MRHLSYEVGKFVWMTKTFEEINYKQCHFKSIPLSRPIQKKIISIVINENEVLYQTNKGHFAESLIGKVVFNTEEEALKAMLN